MVDKWEQGAVKHRGRVRRYIHEIYGDAAFEKDKHGRTVLKEGYLNKAEMRANREGNTSLVRAINLAKTFKKQAMRA